MNKLWMIYGCYGYSGDLIVDYAVSCGLTPILAGRSHEKTLAQASKHNLEFRVFDLDDPDEIRRNIENCFLVFNAAGPYTLTCRPMLEACLSAGTHNLSLVGEIPLLEELHQLNQRATEAGIMLAVGLGYDVHPTDCLANLLKEKLPNATHLSLAMDGPTGMSPGSYKELIQQIAEQPFWSRRDAKLVQSKPKTSFIDYGTGKKLSSSIAWGDTATAFHSTGIPNIDVYSSVSYLDWFLIKLLRLLSPLIKRQTIKEFAYKLVDKFVAGPSEQEREFKMTQLLGKVVDQTGLEKKIHIEVPSSYRITYLSSVYAIEKILNGDITKTGYLTPAQLLGSRSIFDIADVKEVSQ